VDGEASPDERSQVEAHVAGCASCRSAVTAQRTVRAVLRARAAELRVPAPPGLRTRLAATLEADAPRVLGWRGRLSAVAVAAVALLTTVVGLEFVRPGSNVIYAAQLALDHVRCFVVELAATTPADAAALRQNYLDTYGWDVRIPPSNDTLGVTLVAARRCPYWLGRHAHLLYRTGGHEVSLYISRDEVHPDDELRVLGHTERIWHAGGASYAAITRGVPAAEWARITEYLQRERSARNRRDGVTTSPVGP
jgi:anti-sigma factor RsiW